MLPWLVYVVFSFLVVAGACVLVLLKFDEFFTRRRVVVCPETRSREKLEIDTRHAFKTLFRNIAELRVGQCARWPARAECDQECLLQIDTEPAILDRTLAKFYAGKDCARCGKPLNKADWTRGRFAMLNATNELVPAGRMPLREFPMALEDYRPVFWACHQAERSQQPMPATLCKGDRRGHRDEPWLD
jgi:hypothetical protein